MLATALSLKYRVSMSLPMSVSNLIQYKRKFLIKSDKDTYSFLGYLITEYKIFI